MPPSSPHRYRVWVLPFACIGVLLLLVGMVPMLLSTSGGTRWLVHRISQKTSQEISVTHLSLTLWGGQRIEGLQIRDRQNSLVLDCPRLETDQSLWRILWSHDLGTCRATRPRISVRPLAGSHPVTHRPKQLENLGFSKVGALDFASAASLMFLNMSDAADAKGEDADAGKNQICKLFGYKVKGGPQWREAGLNLTLAQSDFFPYQGKVFGTFIVTKGGVQVLSEGLDPIQFQEIELQLEMPKGKDLMALTLACATEQKEVQGKVDVSACVSQLNAPLPQLVIHANLSQLPVRGIDQILAQFQPQYAGMLLSALGPMLNMQLEATLEEWKLKAQAPFFQANLVAQTENGVIAVHSPATLSLTLTPEFVQKLSQLFPSLREVGLSKPGTLRADIQRFSVPWTEGKMDLSGMAIAGTLQASPAMALTFRGSPWSVDALHMQASAERLQEMLHLEGRLLTQIQGIPNQIEVKGDIAEWGEAGSVDLSVQKLPIFLLGASFPLETYLGTTLDCQGHLDLTAKRLHLTAHTSHLDLPGIDFSYLTWGHKFELVQPASLTYTLPALGEEAWKVTQPVDLQCLLTQFQLPSFSALDELQAALSVQAQQIPLVVAGHPYPLSQVKALLTVKSLESIALTVKSDSFQGSGSGAIRSQGQQIVLTQPLTVEGVMLLHAKTTVPFSLSVEPFTWNRTATDFPQLKGIVQIPQFSFTQSGETLTLQKSQATFLVEPAAKNASFQLTSQVTGRGAGDVRASVTVKNFSLTPAFDLSQALIQGNCELNALSTPVLDLFLGKAVSAWIGPTLNGQCQFQSSPQAKNFSLKASSALMNVALALTATPHAIQLQGSPGELTWTLTPEGYRSLDQELTGQKSKEAPFELQGPTTFTCALSKFYMPVQKEGGFPSFSDALSEVQIVASGKNNGFSFVDRISQEKIQLSQLSFNVNKQADAPILFQMTSSVSSQGKSGSIALNGSWQQGGSCVVDGKINQFPTRIFDLMARAKGFTHSSFSKIFGETLDATLQTQLTQSSGPLRLNINSPNTRVSVEGRLVSGALILNQPLHAQSTLTPEVSQLFLKEVNPLGISSISSEAPVTIEIPAKDFYFPLHPFDLKRISIPQGKIELGKIRCQNEGNINTTLSLLKSKQFEKGKEMTLWFAPIDFHLSRGIMDIERTEILLSNTFDIALWGKIDLVEDYLDMLLGLTAQTLQKAFGIKDLPENYVLTIPMKGPLNNVQINTGKATAKVALLLAWQQASLAGAAAGGPAGALIGGILGKVASLPDGNAKVPPAKHPFPWEVGKKGNKKETSFSDETSSTLGKKKHFKQKERPLQQVLKILR